MITIVHLQQRQTSCACWRAHKALPCTCESTLFSVRTTRPGSQLDRGGAAQVRAQDWTQAARGSQCTAPTASNSLQNWTFQGFGMLEVTQLHSPVNA